jgi:hypothetical protein
MTKVRPLVLIAVVVLVAAVTVVLAGGRLPWSDDSSSGGCDIPDRVSGVSASAVSAPGGGGVRVVEQGFTQDPNSAVSLGAVLENTGSSIAYRTQVAFRLFDASHSELPEAGPTKLTVEIPVILPGQRIGTGSGTYSANVQVASIEVGFGVTTWVPRDAVGHSFSPVTATYLRTARFNPRIPTSVDVHYQETSANCRSLDNRTTAVVFRDATGKVVGGDVTSPDTPIIFRDEQGNDLGGEKKRPPSPSCSQGERETWIVPPRGEPVTADDARTTIYPYCDLSGP